MRRPPPTSPISPTFVASRRTLGRTCRGFTLVELLVVIAIIGVLISLLLPAVQSAREAARRCSCANNIVQVGLALHSHEFHVERFPAGVTDPEGPIRNVAEGKHVGWIVRILPYLEQQVLWRHFDEEAGAYGEANRPVRAASIAPLLCPSALTRPKTEIDGVTVARTTYAGCHHDVEAPIDADNRGVLFRNSGIRFSDIEDGSSNTLLIGEHLLADDDLGWISGTRSTLRNTSRIEQPPQNRGPEDVPRDPLVVGGFGSHHPGVVTIGLADGATRSLSVNVSETILRQLGDRADGEIPEAP
jgi:prepilin-type N-terminal cleavage/methylation domain-containing protein